MTGPETRAARLCTDTFDGAVREAPLRGPKARPDGLCEPRDAAHGAMTKLERLFLDNVQLGDQGTQFNQYSLAVHERFISGP